MTERKLDLAFAFFSYGGNGGISSEHPDVRNWAVKTVAWCKQQNRIGEIYHCTISDTPITMSRNYAVERAKHCGADILVMVDSDMAPDIDLGYEPYVEPFFQSAFDFIHKRYDVGPTVVGAPYCGPPPHENVYVFRWANWQNGSANPDMRIEAYSREEAAVRSGFETVAALPTGLIAFDMRAFDLVDPPYFYYEYTDKTESAKASTEDVTATRDIAMHGLLKLGYSPIFVNWSAWAGHWKPKCVDKPKLISADHVSSKYREAVLRGSKSHERLIFVGERNKGANGPGAGVQKVLPVQEAPVADRLPSQG